MKKAVSILLAVRLCVCACFCSLAGSVADWTDRWESAVSDSTVIALSPGAEPSEMRFAWLSALTAKNAFELAHSADLADAVSLSVRENISITGQKVCRVTAENLASDTEYYYRYTKNGAWSDVYAFRTPADRLTALFVSDAQLGRSGDRRAKDVLLHDVAGWDTTLEEAARLYPDVSLVLSAGDQAEVGFSEQEYRLFLAPDLLRSVPLAPIVGNHEFYFPYLNLHFNLPNRIGSSAIHFLSDEPYYFTRGNALFIQIDSNDPLVWDHEAVLEKAVRAYPDAKWRVVMMHHSLYSCEDSETDAPHLRKSLSSLFQKYNINLVLSGHTHRYSRSFPLWDGAVCENGITYLEGGCSSACNSKACPETVPSYTAAGYCKSDIAVYSVLEFSDDAIRIRSYAVEEGCSVEMDSSKVIAYPRSDADAHMHPLIRVLQAALSVCGRLVSVMFR